MEVSQPFAAMLALVNAMREGAEMECLREEDEAALGMMLLTLGTLLERSQFAGLPERAGIAIVTTTVGSD